MTQNYEIKNCRNGEVLFTCKIPEGMESWVIARHALEAAIAGGADLRGANLKGVNLRGVNLEGVNLRGVNLEGANLRGVNLRGVNLIGANLEDADLEGVNLEGANLRGANLEDVNLRGAKNAPITISGLRWFVVINGFAEMQIGCQRHSVEEWKLFNDKQISSMGNGALEFWNKYKTMLLAVCETHVHTKQEEV